MKMHVLNDLHIEFADFDPPQTDADVVVLAGDIHTGTRGVKMTEYKRVRLSPQFRRFCRADAAAIHRRSVVWLKDELAREHPGPFVVVTHHLPSMQAMPERSEE